ncbi:hypothetical protein VZ94_13785 [Methylocucumis oryzae]|uniref:Uncharacterized protein n=2 Tax=Methylocucumis oryzae TaxID=1632867 RepID=A0A0F3IH44_9GAMM|nr:hypothetical protein VZ94_13785 [Methylocucumis oryzae]
MAVIPLEAAAWQQFDAWLARLLITQLRTLGVLTDVGQSHSIQALMANAKIHPRFQRWLHEGLTILAQNGHIHLQGDAVTVLAAPEVDDVFMASLG